jgi:methanogenic corrinoid protein MtbC1
MDPTRGQDDAEGFLDAIVAGDTARAEQVLAELASGPDADQAVEGLLATVMARISSAWEAFGGVLTLSHAYLAAKVIEHYVEAHLSTAGEATRGPVVVGNAEDDYHALGRRLVAICLEAARWRVIDLGNDVPPCAFVDAAVESGARVIGVSAMIHATALNALRVREEIDRRGLTGRLMLAVGGAVFALRPDLVAQVGADGTARSAVLAPTLFEELWERAKT